MQNPFGSLKRFILKELFTFFLEKLVLEFRKTFGTLKVGKVMKVRHFG